MTYLSFTRPLLLILLIALISTPAFTRDDMPSELIPLDGQEQSYPEFLKLLSQGMQARNLDYKTWFAYTMHTQTPGYKLYKITTRLKDGNIIPEKYINWRKDFFKATDRPLDLFVDGKFTFFTVEMEDGSEAYTLDGRFMRNEDGMLVTIAYELPVLGTEGKIFIPDEVPDEGIEITSHGVIYGGGDKINTLKITEFKNQEGLWGYQGTLFYIRDKSKAKKVHPPKFLVKQGYIEMGNEHIGHKYSQSFVIYQYESMSRVTKIMIDSYGKMFRATGPE